MYRSPNRPAGTRARSLLIETLAAWLLVACGGGDSSEPAPSTAQTQAATRQHAQTLALPTQATWSPALTFPVLPAAMANLPDGKVLMWSADDRLSFYVTTGLTYSSIFDPVSGTSTERLISETGHDMFCPGTTYLADGRLLVNGGIDANKTSLYDPSTGSWTIGPTMNTPRGYNANTLLPDGSVLTVGGSWSGGAGEKSAERWTASAGWQRLPNVPTVPMLTADAAGAYRSDNHMWLVTTPSGRVLQAGPSAAMNWIDPAGNGATTPAGPRGDDSHSMNGNLVMYDVGKLLKTGGARDYDGSEASSATYAIDVTAGVSVRKLAPMSYARAFHNSVVLPNGQVLVIGGQTYAQPFSDDRSVLVPELWDPVTEHFTALAPMTVPRNYHSTALLLPDARVLSAGGGLCGSCSTNHADGQILTPHYLLNADGTAATRPLIVSAPSQAGFGTSASVQTDSPIGAFVLIRLGINTHSVDNDQRRIPLSFRSAGANRYLLDVPSNPSVALPGLYMLFAMNANGVPSIAKTLRIGGDTSPVLQSVADQSAIVAAPVQLQLAATSRDGSTLGYAASGLPPGLTIDAASGLVSGTPTAEGSYRVSVSAAGAAGKVSTDFVWRVVPAGQVRWVKLEEVSEVNGNPWASMAELNLLDAFGATVPRSGWTASASSQETVLEPGAAANAIDGDINSYWLTKCGTNAPVPPHSFIVDLGTTMSLSGFRYRPRPAPNTAGTFAGFRFYVSSDGVDWGTPVAQGDFTTMGAVAAEKTVRFSASVGNHPPTLTAPDDQSNEQGQTVGFSIVASDLDGDALSYSASGLPPGLAINPASGLISGNVTTIGTYNVAVTVQDSQGASTNASFVWKVPVPTPVVAPIATPVKTVGSAVSYTATASGTGLSYAWDFGDGSAVTAYSASPGNSHTYAQPGLYTVTLSVRSTAGTSTNYSFTQAIALPLLSGHPQSTSALAIETRVDGSIRLWVTNQDNDSVSVLDATSYQKLAEIPVGRGPRTLAISPISGRIWVIARDGAEVDVIDPLSLSVVQTAPLPRGSQPFGIVFTPDGTAYASLEATGTLVKLDAAGAIVQSLVVGTNARDLSATASGGMLLLSRFITPPMPGEGTAIVQTSVNGVNRGGEVVSLALPGMTVNRRIQLQHSEKVDSTVQGRGLPNYLGPAVISPDGQSAWVPSKQDNIKRGTLRDGLPLDFQNTVRAISSRIDMATLTEDYPSRIDHDNAGVASAAAFHPNGAYLFVALETSREVAVIDPAGAREIMRFDTGMAPQALAVSPDGKRLFVSNLMDRSVGIYDLSRLVDYGQSTVPLLTTVGTVTVEKLTPAVLRGKQLFYDARDTRLARDAYLSCASCHRDGGRDGRTWDFTSLGEGLRNTISLRGRAGAQGLLHWSGNFDEVQDFEGQIRSLAKGSGLMSDTLFNTGTRSQPLGLTKAGLSSDLDALASYVKSLSSADPSPYRPSATTLSSDAAAGKLVFQRLDCAACHGGTSFTGASNGLMPLNIGSLKASSGMRLGATLPGIDVPTLRDVWATAPYLHDGSAATLADAVLAHSRLSIADADLQTLVAYLRAIGSDEAVAPASTVVAAGLDAQYFGGVTLSGTPLLSRVEAVDFQWDGVSPGPGVPIDNFSARWSGSVLAPTTGAYVFRTLNDDGVRLWINGVLVIDDWMVHIPTGVNITGPINLVAGQRYPVQVEYLKGTGQGTMRLQWQPPGTSSLVAIPATQLYSSIALPVIAPPTPAMTTPPVDPTPPPPPTTWTTCAPEGGTCSFSGTRAVRFGANGSFATKMVASSIVCNNAAFGGDPVPYVAKHCELADPVPTVLPPAIWTPCGGENTTCTFSGTRTVRYGANGLYATKSATGSIACSNAAFGGDPVPYVAKQCDVATLIEVLSPTAEWTQCAVEGATCNVTGTRTVRFGQGTQYVTRQVSGSAACTVAVFGSDPAPYTAKHCDADYGQTAAMPIASWIKCADQYATCSISGTRLVRYGAVAGFAWRIVTGSIRCEDGVWGDPSPGNLKQCQIQP